ncbi:guanine nucleotide-binding protein subunit beta-like protein 1 [Alosa pseudoharengus]|uniref:guanine nucleotide-binding protein subunit beta-like protein 1 n=1 Tax=Alosa pseudoharengus TaxID=34774 RepID=UPI003F8A6577
MWRVLSRPLNESHDIITTFQMSSLCHHLHRSPLLDDWQGKIKTTSDVLSSNARFQTLTLSQPVLCRHMLDIAILITVYCSLVVYFVHSSTKGAVHIWNLNTRRPEKVLEGHGGSSVIWVNTLSRETVLSQGRDMRVCLWPLSEGRGGEVCDSLYTGSVGFCQCSLLSRGPSSSLLAYASEQMEEVKVMELPSNVPVCSLKPDKKLGMVMCLKIWQPDAGEGPLLVAGYEDGSVLLWDVTQGRPLSSLSAHPEPVMCLDVDPGRQRGVSGSAENTIRSWALDGQQNLQQQESVELLNPGISQLQVRGDGKILAAAGWDHRIRVFGWKRLKPLAVLKCHTDMMLSVTFSDHADPTKRLMAAGSKDQRISIWSIYNQN